MYIYNKKISRKQLVLQNSPVNSNKQWHTARIASTKHIIFFKPCNIIHTLFIAKIFLVGLGYKNFAYNRKLYILIGDSNYILLEIPSEINILCRKNQIFGISKNKINLLNFFSSIKYLKKLNLYKGKGILEFKNFKFMKLKTGKKQKV